VLAGVLAGAILTAYVASVRYPEVRVLKQPATSDQIRRGSGLSHELREHQARHPCGAGKDFAYHASAMELEWTQAPPKHGRICSTSHSAHQRRDASVWLNYSQRSHGPSRPPTLDEAAVPRGSLAAMARTSPSSHSLALLGTLISLPGVRGRTRKPTYSTSRIWS